MAENKIVDFVSGSLVVATPEEVNAVQPFSKILVEDYNYPKEMLQTHPQLRVKASPSDKKGYPVDIAVYDLDDKGNKALKMVVENKKPTVTDGLEQLKLYLKFCEATIGIWYKIFIDTTLPNIADRWKELKIPIYKNSEEFERIKKKVKNVVSYQWKSLKEIDDFRKNYDIHNT